MTAYGYVRKSVMSDDLTTLSPAVQRERVAALAKAHCDDDITILEDLDVSGAKVEERRDYVRLVRAIESGEASAMYAYDLSRLHRNTEEALRFFRRNGRSLGWSPSAVRAVVSRLAPGPATAAF